MASKKSTKKIVKDVEIALDPKPLAIDDVTRLTLIKLSLEELVARKDFELIKREREAYLKSIDPEGKLEKMDHKLQNLVNVASQFRQRFQEAASRAGEKLGVNLAEYAFDEETGVLTKIGE